MPSNDSQGRPFAFVLMPFDPQFDDFYSLGIKRACELGGAYCERVDEQLFMENVADRVFTQIRKADFIIADVTGRNPNVLYEVGIARGMGKMIVLLASDLRDAPYDIRHYRVLVYERRVSTLVSMLKSEVETIVASLGEIDALSQHGAVAARQIRDGEPMPKASMATVAPSVRRDQVFISYSHHDRKWLKRLQVHLRPLERDNQVRRWDDTMLDVGDEWRKEIAAAVAAAKVAILLVSADFIASEFIYINELPPLLAAAESEGAVIMPIIISPSRFEHIRNLSRFQAFNSPSKPLINMSRTQQEQLFVNVATKVANVLGAPSAG